MQNKQSVVVMYRATQCPWHKKKCGLYLSLPLVRTLFKNISLIAKCSQMSAFLSEKLVPFIPLERYSTALTHVHTTKCFWAAAKTTTRSMLVCKYTMELVLGLLRQQVRGLLQQDNSERQGDMFLIRMLLVLSITCECENLVRDIVKYLEQTTSWEVRVEAASLADASEQLGVRCLAQGQFQSTICISWSDRHVTQRPFGPKSNPLQTEPLQ